MEGADVVTPGPTRPPDPLHIRKNTQKSKFLLSQTLKWKKIMFFVIPELPSKTFVMVQKKLPDHLNESYFRHSLRRILNFLNLEEDDRRLRCTESNPTGHFKVQK